jgi:NADP-dependent 3-hydroxy acid dehydrogenase YdfG
MTSTATSRRPAPADAPLTGRVAFVTGASSGIGQAIARQLADAGARVAAVARRADRLDALGPDVLAVPADVSDPDAVRAAVERTVAELGPPDLVVTAAGVMLPSDIDEARLDLWQRTFDVNLTGIAATVAATVPHLIAAAADGRTADLVMVSSVGDQLSFPGYAFYGASKAAVTKLCHELHLDLAPHGVRTLNLRPGLVASELQSKVTDPARREQLEQWLEDITALTPDEIAGPLVAALGLPRHVCVSELTVVPTAQVDAL